MSLPNELVSQFVKVSKPVEQPKKETTVYGTIQDYGGDKYVRLDGSELLTPIVATTDVQFGERVTVMIKDHTATVTGNISSPSASDASLRAIGDEISEFEIILAGKVDTVELVAVKGRIDNLETENLTVRDTLLANNAAINELYANNVKIEQNLTAHSASIENLEANKLSATDAELKYANIDFTNIGQATMEYFYAQSGLIKNVTVDNQTITGELVGVTLKGDLIEGGTVVADKLVMLGSDGLYYKLNTDGMSISAEQTEYNSLNGSVITAKSITAEKVSVSDLVAFDAKIANFTITDHTLYSGVKASVENTTRGIFLQDDGQIAFGDASNYIKYYKDSDGNYKLDISADNLSFTSSSNGLISAINQSSETIKINASKIDLQGAVTFSTFDSSTQNLINNASSAASSAQSAANSALSRVTSQYGTCSTSASTAAKVVSLSGFELYTGATITVKFTYANTAANATLNVNGTGAKSIYAHNATLAQPYYWSANSYIAFTYDGSRWLMQSSPVDDAVKNWCYNNNKTYIDGGSIYAKSVTASQIDVDDLFAQNLTASGNIMFDNGYYSIANDGNDLNLKSNRGNMNLQSHGTLTMRGSGTVQIFNDVGHINIGTPGNIVMEVGSGRNVTVNGYPVVHSGNIDDYIFTPYTEYKTGTNSNVASSATNALSYAIIVSLTLSAGVWVVIGSAGSWTSGTFMGAIYRGSTVEDCSRSTVVSTSATSCYVNCSTIMTLTTSTTVSVRAAQSSGSSKSVNGYIRAVRVA